MRKYRCDPPDLPWCAEGCTDRRVCFLMLKPGIGGPSTRGYFYRPYLADDRGVGAVHGGQVTTADLRGDGATGIGMKEERTHRIRLESRAGASQS
jgi:hypothetical protein